jgi:hypothetical protein
MPTWDDLKLHTLNGLIKAKIGESKEVQTGPVADAVMIDLWLAVERGEPWAVVLVRKAAREGVRRAVYTIAHRGRSRATDSRTGETIYIPTHINVTTPKNGRPASYQLRLWYDIPWPILIQSVGEIARQHGVLGRDLRVFSEVIKLRDQFPESRTPREACKLAGKDPSDFDLASELSG